MGSVQNAWEILTIDLVSIRATSVWPIEAFGQSGVTKFKWWTLRIICDDHSHRLNPNARAYDIQNRSTPDYAAAMTRVYNLRYT